MVDDGTNEEVGRGDSNERKELTEQKNFLLFAKTQPRVLHTSARDLLIVTRDKDMPYAMWRNYYTPGLTPQEFSPDTAAQFIQRDGKYEFVEVTHYGETQMDSIDPERISIIFPFDWVEMEGVSDVRPSFIITTEKPDYGKVNFYYGYKSRDGNNNLKSVEFYTADGNRLAVNNPNNTNSLTSKKERGYEMKSFKDPKSPIFVVLKNGEEVAFFSPKQELDKDALHKDLANPKCLENPVRGRASYDATWNNIHNNLRDMVGLSLKWGSIS
jgi:hypothetical protein